MCKNTAAFILSLRIQDKEKLSETNFTRTLMQLVTTPRTVDVPCSQHAGSIYSVVVRRNQDDGATHVRNGHE